MSLNKKIIILSILLGFTLLLSGFIFEQPQQEFKAENLQILPQDISGEELEVIMKSFNTALGVKCSYCHAKSLEDSKKLNFASDDKLQKMITRKMMKMTREINDNYFTWKDQEGQISKITCNTCHNGEITPSIRKVSE